MARIQLGSHELEKFRQEVSQVLEYVDALKQVDTQNAPEIFEVTGLVNVQREDKTHIAENREEIFSQAPETKDGYFKVKAIL